MVCRVTGINLSLVTHNRQLSEACAGLSQCGQATKGVWGMSRRQEAKKGVEDCDKLGGMVKRVLIPRFPNDPKLNP